MAMERTYVSRLERGETNPTLNTIIGLALSLNISPRALVPEN